MKVEPSPGLLSTVMSPPIIWQKRLLIASPRPVPPYLRVVEASAWENSWNSLPICSSVIPMPVSVDRDRDPVAAIKPLLGRAAMRDGALLGELVGIAHQVEQRLSKPGLVCVNRAEVRGGNRWRSGCAFFVAIGSMVLATSSISGTSGNDSR